MDINEIVYSKCRVLNHRLSDNNPMETPPKKNNTNGNWQVICMSNLVFNMLNEMKQMYDDSGDPECSEQVKRETCQFKEGELINHI
jgi:hypothetical protein